MTRKANRPEDLWADATYQQVADLREWIQSRMKRRHADSISAWLLSLGTDEPVSPHKRQLAFFRRILDEYGPPRQAIAESNRPPEPRPDPPGEAPGTPSSHSAGRFHRA